MFKRVNFLLQSPFLKGLTPGNPWGYASLARPLASTAKPEASRKRTVSKAMRAYLERSKEHDEFMRKQNVEFQIGKRHLANMMGENPDTFTQEDVDAAIDYLFPSALFEKRARPMMKPPEEIFPQRKAAEFDETGRPHHFLFYTSKPNFYKIIHDIVSNINHCYKIEDEMNRKGIPVDPNLALELSGYSWLDKESLEKECVETISDKDYENFTATFDRLSVLPYSYKFKDFIFKYRKPLMSHTKTMEAPKPQIDENGRSFITVYECMRKAARGHVTIRQPGTGKITINGKDLTYFRDQQSREQIARETLSLSYKATEDVTFNIQLLFPLHFTNLLNKVDFEAEVSGGGYSGQAGAIRWGLAWGLRSFVTPEMVEEMRLAGLLSRDVRKRERMKPGQEGARKKFTWKKR